MFRRATLTAIAAVTGLASITWAQPAVAPAPAPAAVAAAVAQANRQFAGINFGVGVSATWDTGSEDRVSAASIDANGILRVDRKENVRARVMLESHYFFPGKKTGPTGEVTRGYGPFVALQPGDDEVIQAIGLGWMFGFRRGQPDDVRSFNLGIGYVVEPSVQVLGDEFTENMPAPLDPDGDFIPVRFQHRDQGGVLLLASFSWR